MTVTLSDGTTYTFQPTISRRCQPFVPILQVSVGFTFNLHRVAETDRVVVVVEGFFDFMKVHQAGIRSVVALMGSVLHEPQRQALLKRSRSVTLLLDGDSTGRKASTVIAHSLQPHCSVQEIRLPDGLQPDQMTAEDIQEALQRFANDD